MTSLSSINDSSPPNDSISAFSVRIVSVDSYMAKPIAGMDICYSSFIGCAIDSVPVVRIFGATPSGQKTCVHLHKAFPYFFLAFDDDLAVNDGGGGGGLDAVNAYARRLAISIERAVDVSLGKVRSFGSSQV
jgi:DNA polymerase zeta